MEAILAWVCLFGSRAWRLTVEVAEALLLFVLALAWMAVTIVGVPLLFCVMPLVPKRWKGDHTALELTVDWVLDAVCRVAALGLPPGDVKQPPAAGPAADPCREEGGPTLPTGAEPQAVGQASAPPGEAASAPSDALPLLGEAASAPSDALPPPGEAASAPLDPLPLLGEAALPWEQDLLLAAFEGRIAREPYTMENLERVAGAPWRVQVLCMALTLDPTMTPERFLERANQILTIGHLERQLRLPAAEHPSG